MGLLGWLRDDKPEHAPAEEERARLSATVVRNDVTERLEDMGPIAKGGMSSIRQVFDNNLLRTVAMKVLDPKLAGKEIEVQRFFEEAQITGQLDHPNIPPVHELGIAEDGTCYFTMKLVRGKTLDALLGTEEYAIQTDRGLFKVLQVFTKVCQAISFAHSRGVIHCDLKPLNVMVGSHGQVYVMDWGLARLVGEARPSGTESISRTLVQLRHDEPIDDTGRIMGTVGFMAPEQAQGRNDELDERTDIFQLGAVLYRILTGHRPFTGARPEDALLKAARCQFLPPQKAAGHPLPKRLCAVVTKAMAEDPALRYQSVDDLQQEIETFLLGADRYRTVTFPRGSLIVSEGEKGDTAYIVARGRCTAFKTVNGQRQALREMGEGAVIGEASIFADSPRTASVEATEDVTAYAITRESLEEELGRTMLTQSFVKALAERFRDVDQQAARLRDVSQSNELARFTLEHLAFEGETIDGCRVARLSPLVREVCERYGWTEAQARASLRRVRGAGLDEAADRISYRSSRKPAVSPPSPNANDTMEQAVEDEEEVSEEAATILGVSPFQDEEDEAQKTRPPRSSKAE